MEKISKVWFQLSNDSHVMYFKPVLANDMQPLPLKRSFPNIFFQLFQKVMSFEKRFFLFQIIQFLWNDKKFRKRILSQLMTCRHPRNRPPPSHNPLESGQICFLVQKDASFSETYEKNTFFDIYFLTNGWFCTEILRKFGQIFSNLIQKC